MLQVAGATGVGAGLSGHRSTAWLAATPYCIYNERLREYLTLERSPVQDRDTRLCELSWFQSLTSSNWIKFHVHQRFKWAPTVREIIQVLGLDFSWSLSFVLFLCELKKIQCYRCGYCYCVLGTQQHVGLLFLCICVIDFIS